MSSPPSQQPRRPSGIDAVRAARAAAHAGLAGNTELVATQGSERSRAPRPEDTLATKELLLYREGYATAEVSAADGRIRRELGQITFKWVRDSVLASELLTHDQVAAFLRLSEPEQRAAVHANPAIFFRIPQVDITAGAMEGAFMASAKVRKVINPKGWSSHLFHVLSWAPRELHLPRTMFQACAGVEDWRYGLAAYPRCLPPRHLMEVFTKHHPHAGEEFAKELCSLNPWGLVCLPASLLTTEVIEAARVAAHAKKHKMNVDALLNKSAAPSTSRRSRAP